MGGCHHLLLVYDASMLSTVYVVKWPVLGLQRAPENSEFAPSLRTLCISPLDNKKIVQKKK